MTKSQEDGLLVTARIVIVLIKCVLIAAMVGIGIGIAVLFGMGPDDLWARLSVSKAPTGIFVLLQLSLAIVAVIVAITFRFFGELYEIIMSVERGAPFTGENAGRLRRMGWQSVIVQALLVGLSLISKYVDPFLERSVKGLGFDFGVDPGTVLLILVLFILARVFERGAAIQADLEGTV